MVMRYAWLLLKAKSKHMEDNTYMLYDSTVCKVYVGVLGVWGGA